MQHPLPVQNQAQGFSALACEVLDYVKLIFPLFPYSFYSFCNKKQWETGFKRSVQVCREYDTGTEGQCSLRHSGGSLPISDIAEHEQSLPTYSLANREFTQFFMPSWPRQVREFSHFPTTFSNAPGWHWAEEQVWPEPAGRLALEFGVTRDDGDGRMGGSVLQKSGGTEGFDLLGNKKGNHACQSLVFNGQNTSYFRWR